MEILESIAWITLGFLPVFCSMELAWRLRRKLVVSKSRAEGERDDIKESLDSTKSSSSPEFDWVWEDVIREMEIPTTAIRPRT
jgi:hypothetical protein